MYIIAKHKKREEMPANNQYSSQGILELFGK